VRREWRGRKGKGGVDLAEAGGGKEGSLLHHFRGTHAPAYNP